MQPDYKEYQGKYIAGQKTKDVDFVPATGVSEDSTDILFGQLAVKGASAGLVKLPTAAFTFQDIAGIVVYSTTDRVHALKTNVTAYQAEDSVALAKKGYMAVTLTGTVAEGGKLFFVHTAGGASALHTWRGDLDTDKASAIPAIATVGGVSGDTIEIKLNTDMGIGIT